MKGGTLIIQRKQLGDLVLTQPLVERCAADGPVVLDAPEAFAPLVALMPGEPRLQAAWRPGRWERVLCLDAGGRSLRRLPGRFAHIKRIFAHNAAQRRWWGRLLGAHYVEASSKQLYRARAYWEMGVTGEGVSVGAGEGFRPPRLMSPPDEWMPQEFDGEEAYVLIHPTAAWQRKCWTVEGWRAVVAWLLEERRMRVVLTTGAQAWEVEHGRLIAVGFDRVCSLAGRTSLKGFLSVVSRASACLSVDGAAAHLAAAWGKPSLVLFGPSSPVHWHHPRAGSVCLDASSLLGRKRTQAAEIPASSVLENLPEVVG